MKKIESDYSEHDHTLTVKICGEMSALTSFPSLPKNQVKQIIVQLEEAGYVNSDGVQNWMKWIREVQAANESIVFCFKFLPSNFARLAYQVKGFLPARSKIESVIVPYFCSDCAVNFMVKYIKGKKLSPKEQKDLIEFQAQAACGYELTGGKAFNSPNYPSGIDRLNILLQEPEVQKALSCTYTGEEKCSAKIVSGSH